MSVTIVFTLRAMTKLRCRLVELIRTVTPPTRHTILLFAGFGLVVIACADDTRQLEVGQLILLSVYLVDADWVVDAVVAHPSPKLADGQELEPFPNEHAGYQNNTWTDDMGTNCDVYTSNICPLRASLPR